MKVLALKVLEKIRTDSIQLTPNFWESLSNNGYKPQTFIVGFLPFIMSNR